MKAILYLFINFLLVSVAIYFYYTQAKPIIERTENVKVFTTILIASFSLLTAILMFKLKRFRKYGLGISSLIFSIFIFSFFSLNKVSSKEGFVRYRQLSMLTVYDKDISYYSTLDLGTKKQRFKVDVNQCFEFDSVDLKIIHGQFGFNYYTVETRITPSKYCLVKIANEKQDKYLYGIELIKKRCFDDAQEYYSTLITIEPFNDELLYYRGLIYLFKNEYKLALSDFLLGATLFYSETENIKKIDTKKLIRDILKKVDNKTFDVSILNDITSLENISESSDYYERIRFCVLKLKST